MYSIWNPKNLHAETLADHFEQHLRMLKFHPSFRERRETPHLLCCARGRTSATTNAVDCAARGRNRSAEVATRTPAASATKLTQDLIRYILDITISSLRYF
jgi:hypothetical protein